MMNNYLGYSKDFLEKHKALYTAMEISHQPKIWRQVYQNLNDNLNEISSFMMPYLTDKTVKVIFTGAGSSAFIGDMLAPILREKNIDAHSYGTTEILSNPNQYFNKSHKTLLVSFARSGNSPESLAAVQLADQMIEHCSHLFITCNPDSALSQYQSKSKSLKIITPAGTHDIGFAMTSSISSMILSAILIFDLERFCTLKDEVDEIISLCEQKLKDWNKEIKALAKQDFKRVIYVGSGCFTGVAREAALKALELTAGVIATRFDSSLGLRHGPKFMVDSETLFISYLSNNAHTRKYDLDLFNEIQNDHIAKKTIALSGIDCVGESNCSNLFTLNSKLNDAWLIFPFLLFAQMYAFEKSLALNLTPDNPCPTGEVNRVVKGVVIYSYSNN